MGMTQVTTNAGQFQARRGLAREHHASFGSCRYLMQSGCIYRCTQGLSHPFAEA